MPVDEVAAEIDRYVLCTGEAAADRLRILHWAYEPGTRPGHYCSSNHPALHQSPSGRGVDVDRTADRLDPQALLPGAAASLL